MPSPQAKLLHVSSLQQELLQQMTQRTTSVQRLVKRSHIIWPNRSVASVRSMKRLPHLRSREKGPSSNTPAAELCLWKER